MGREMNLVAVKAEYRTIGSFAELLRTPRDGLEHRLDVGRRARDDPQDLRGCGLLLQGLCHLRVDFSELTVLLLYLLEQPDVLDRDHRLVGEGLDQPDLLLREWRNDRARDRDGADRLAFPQQRHRHHRAQVARPAQVDLHGTQGRVAARVDDLHRSPVERRSTDDRARSHRQPVARRSSRSSPCRCR